MAEGSRMLVLARDRGRQAVLGAVSTGELLAKETLKLAEPPTARLGPATTRRGDACYRRAPVIVICSTGQVVDVPRRGRSRRRARTGARALVRRRQLRGNRLGVAGVMVEAGATVVGRRGGAIAGHPGRELRGDATRGWVVLYLGCARGFEGSVVSSATGQFAGAAVTGRGCGGEGGLRGGRRGYGVAARNGSTWHS